MASDPARLASEPLPPPSRPQPPVLPMARAELDALGWDGIDILLVTGDAYVDHPSFGAALLGRWLIAHGWRVGIVAQPDWRDPEAVAALGRPRLFAGVTAGALDSMLAHYTAFRKKRSDDAYTPGGRAGARPNRATIVYTGLVKQAFPGLPVVVGGIEASLRRLSHYDFWSDHLRRSILLDSKADVLLYGMAEGAILALAALCESLAYTETIGETTASAHNEPNTTSTASTTNTASSANKRDPANAVAAARTPGGLPRAALARIGGAVWAGTTDDLPDGAAVETLPDHEAILADPRRLMPATLAMERQVHRGAGYLAQAAGGRTVVVAPPAPPASTETLDRLHGLPYTRAAHPRYTEPVPAASMVRFSITAQRGCGGGCSFCALALHQGRRCASRSEGSILAEAEAMTRHPDWTGSITDVGGPTANLWGARCTLTEADPGKGCTRSSCLTPGLCKHLRVDAEAYLALLRRLRDLPGVQHVRVASGVRYDLALRSPETARALVAEFVGGQLKLAPEHVDDAVLTRMRKPPIGVFERFLDLFAQASARAGKEQYVVPYLMTGFPGCGEPEARRLTDWLAARRWRPQQVQCFIPLPGTVAAAMYFGGVDEAGRPIAVIRDDAGRLRQHHELLSGTDPHASRGAGKDGDRDNGGGTAHRGKAPRQGSGRSKVAKGHARAGAKSKGAHGTTARGGDARQGDGRRGGAKRRGSR